MSTRLTSVVIEAMDVSRLGRFWAEALNWQFTVGRAVGGRCDDAQAEVPRVAVGQAAVVRPDRPDGVRLLFVPTDRPKANKNRLHLDLAGGPDHAGEVRRLLGLGASLADIGQGEVPWQVLADPEGNELCVLPLPDADPGDLAAICLDAADPGVQGGFWSAATGWPIVDRGAWGVRLCSPAGCGPALVMGPPAAPKSAPNRLQPALGAGPGGDLADSVAGLLAAGAVRADAGTPGLWAEPLADPEHNEFLVWDQD